MASASVTPSYDGRRSAATASPPGGRMPRRRKTNHLKLVPETRELRDTIRQRCDEVAAKLDKSHPLSKDTMESIARATLEDLGLPEGYVGWTMVMLASAFWRDQVAAVPPSRRLFLLPHCLKHTVDCTAEYNEFGLDCKQCGACSIGDFRAHRRRDGLSRPGRRRLAHRDEDHCERLHRRHCRRRLPERAGEGHRQGPAWPGSPASPSRCFRATARRRTVDEDQVREMLLLQHTEPVSSHHHLCAHHASRVGDVRAGAAGASGAARSRWTAIERSSMDRGSRTSSRLPPPKPSLTTSWPREASTLAPSSRWPFTMP